MSRLVHTSGRSHNHATRNSGRLCGHGDEQRGAPPRKPVVSERMQHSTTLDACGAVTVRWQCLIEGAETKLPPVVTTFSCASRIWSRNKLQRISSTESV